MQKDEWSIQLFKQYHIDGLYHITNLQNLGHILEYGLLSHKKAHSRINRYLFGLTVSNISDSDVQDIRRTKKLNNKSLQEYVCLYFNPRNPMLFKIKDQQEELIILAIDHLLLLEQDVYFSDGNAAAQTTKFYNNLSQLKQVNWEIVGSSFWSDQVDGKRIKCSEVLVPFTIAVERIQKVFCYNNKQVQQIEKIRQKLKEERNITPTICLEIKPELYF